MTFIGEQEKVMGDFIVEATVRSSVIGTNLAGSHMVLDTHTKKIINQNFMLKYQCLKVIKRFFP